MKLSRYSYVVVMACAALAYAFGFDTSKLFSLLNLKNFPAPSNSQPESPTNSNPFPGDGSIQATTYQGAPGNVAVPDNAPLVIGSFNIQSFGRSKMDKPDVVAILADIAVRFDILAIQELRDKDENVIPQFLAILNRQGHHYRAAVSRRVGYVDRDSKRVYEEQLVYLYDANRVELIGEPYVAEDRYTRMHRPPYIAHFRCRQPPSLMPFSFVLMNVHTDPDDTDGEFAALVDIIGSIFPNHPGEDDFILLGDLNSDAQDFQQYRWLSNQFPVIPSHWKTNTRQKESFDNIVFDALRTAEFLNQGGVLNLMKEYNLSIEQAVAVSDHMPVWGVFSRLESNSTELTRGPQVMR